MLHQEERWLQDVYSQHRSETIFHQQSSISHQNDGQSNSQGQVYSKLSEDCLCSLLHCQETKASAGHKSVLQPPSLRKHEAHYTVITRN